MTIQNGRPYWMTIFALSKNSYTQPYIDQLEALVAKVTFQNPDSSYLVRADGNNEAQVASASIAKTETKAENFSEDKDTTNTLDELDEDSVIKVVARNQIATVRVGTYRCADMIYTAQNGASMQLNGLCTGGIGSGSIVSDDGYIATNGHVTEVSNQSMIMGLNTQENMNKYIKFVVDAGYVTCETLLVIWQIRLMAAIRVRQRQFSVLSIKFLPIIYVRKMIDTIMSFRPQVNLLRAIDDGWGNLSGKRRRLIFQPRKLTRKLI
ncbi:hypothetical protein KOY49_02600 [Candidatus Minimicrobia vallesae]|uniref:Uncharacterized protein n=1 Tax=Candidatus Minimicrobia vallesae TaxID=2841264 RepID=A0A8F1MA06_9BACT|nr:hypothetical protein [Candidatus Minimicrobia vallesae]QWQ31081.1 hypothetical protein KOY49_02600 [Candidatus Minimicrobia vallesae]